jgi:hypothetical protein
MTTHKNATMTTTATERHETIDPEAFARVGVKVQSPGVPDWPGLGALAPSTLKEGRRR